jgi:peptidoglycan/xylan/chitin deacetylase (PgdA/CDA1 family)
MSIGIFVSVLCVMNSCNGKTRIDGFFKNLEGPAFTSRITDKIPADVSAYADGRDSRLALLLTDPNSAWLGLAHGFKSIGLPFIVTADYKKALQHKVVVVYPLISGHVLDQKSLQALSAHPRNGGTLIAFNVLGGGLNKVFGFSKAIPGSERFAMTLEERQPGNLKLASSHEREILLGDREKSSAMGTYGYNQVTATPLAVYDDGTVAIMGRPIGAGFAYAFGLDAGAFILNGHNVREEDMVKNYANKYQPAIDTLLRWFKAVYCEGEKNAVTLWPVPDNKSVALIITHDVDYSGSIENMPKYAQAEKDLGIKATYFIQTKYITDYNDKAFFGEKTIALLSELGDSGMEIASHSVSHFIYYSQLPLGSGDESFPRYKPFVKDKDNAEGATILGELRVSKFLLDHFTGQTIDSFRSGNLSYPFSQPQALQATGYRFSSSVTANSALTHLPYQLNYNRETSSEVPLFEFPITIEDEMGDQMLTRLPEALALARTLSGYGGLFTVLIHPNITGFKLDFENQLVEGIRDFCWTGTLREFGTWWEARNEIQADVSSDGDTSTLILSGPKKIAGLVVNVPGNWRLSSSFPEKTVSDQGAGFVTLAEFSGRLILTFSKK